MTQGVGKYEQGEHTSLRLSQLNRSFSVTKKLLVPIENKARQELLEFVSKYPAFALSSISRNAPIKPTILAQFEDLWQYGGISTNKSIAWTADIIDNLKERLHWKAFSTLHHSYWSESLLIRFGDFWDWFELSKNASIPWSEALFLRFNDRWSWHGLLKNPAVRFTEKMIRGNLEKLCLEEFSFRGQVEWSESLIEAYEEYWTWGHPLFPTYSLSYNRQLPWSREFILKYIDRWNWSWLSRNPAINWTLDLLIELQHRIDWKELSSNIGTFWTVDIIEMFRNRWDRWQLFKNEGIPWSDDVLNILEYDQKRDGQLVGFSKGMEKLDSAKLHKYKETLDWSVLSGKGFPNWSHELISEFEDRWDWDALSWNESVPWSNALITQYLDKWYWFVYDEDGWMSSWGIQYNNAVVWNKELLMICKDYINPGCLDGKNVEWDLELVKEFNAKCFYMSWDSKKVYQKIFEPYMNDDFLIELMTRIEEAQT